MVNLDHLYKPDNAKRLFINSTNFFVDKKLGFQVIENGMILPNKPMPKEHPSYRSGHSWMGLGGIVDNNDEFVMSSHLRYGINGHYTPPSNQFNIVLKPSSISARFTVYGDIQ